MSGPSQGATVVLSDRTIREELAEGRIVIDPLGEGCIQPASVDLRLGREIRRFAPQSDYSFLDVRDDVTGLTQLEEIPDPAPFILGPGEFILGTTLEHVELPDDIVARLEGKSSLGRLGLLIHSTAGYVDPGWKGQLTLEISNVARVNISLYFQMEISQISFLRLSTPAEHPYGSPELGSKYQGQTGPTASRSHLAFQPRGRERRPYPAEATVLKSWLDASPYDGSVAILARTLGAKHKTVQEWVYGRSQPNREHRQNLFELTGLPTYAPEPGASQPRLSLDGGPPAERALPLGDEK